MNFQPSETLDAGFYENRVNQSWEASKLRGYPIKYLRATNQNIDEIFGEATERDFLQSNSYKMFSFRDEDTQFGGGEVFGGFGYTPTYSDIRYVPVKWFEDAGFKPIEGDIIYDDHYDVMFEITKVGTLTEAHTGDIINNKLINYKIYLKHYMKGNDSFTNFAGDEDTLDAIENDLGLDSDNDELTQDIQDLGIVDSTRNNPFGE